MVIVKRAPRAYRRRLQKLARRPPNVELGRRVLAMLRLMDGHSVTDVALMLEQRARRCTAGLSPGCYLLRLLRRGQLG